jgi:hypothetical protein
MMIGRPAWTTAQWWETGTVTPEVSSPSAPVASPSSSSGASPAARLQNALKTLGSIHGDATLSKVGVDGIIGPKTVKAVNTAIAQKYMSTPYFPNPNLTIVHVKKFASGLADVAEGAVRAAGGTVTAPQVKQHASSILPPIPTFSPSSSGGGPIEFPRWGWWVIGGVSALVLLNALSLSRAEARAGTVRPKRRRVEAAAEA